MASGFRSVVGLAMVVALLGWAPGSAAAQVPDPLAGVGAGVVAVARAIDGGQPDVIAGFVAFEPIVRTSYPGDGVQVSRDTAIADIRAAVVSNAAAGDVLGGGAYRLIAVWIPRSRPSEVYLLGSGIDARGNRMTTVFTMMNTGQTIIAYGRAGNTQAVLEQFARDGDLRLVPLGTVLPPATGSGSESAHHRIPLVAASVVVMGSALALAALGKCR